MQVFARSHSSFWAHEVTHVAGRVDVARLGITLALGEIGALRREMGTQADPDVELSALEVSPWCPQSPVPRGRGEGLRAASGASPCCLPQSTPRATALIAGALAGGGP